MMPGTEPTADGRRLRPRCYNAVSPQMGRKGRDGDGTLEELVRLAVEPLGFAASAVMLIGIIWLGIELGKGTRGGELVRALALIAAGGVVLGFAAIYGYTG